MNGSQLLWKCDPTSALGVEINNEVVYGGTDGSNLVAEVDVTVGLCQIISGFTPGEVYELSFDCSGRSSTCGPPVQTMDVIIDGGALLESITRDNTFFNLANERFCFTATQTTHELSFNSTTVPAQSCGNIVDNVVINSYNLNIDSEQTLCLGETIDFDVSAFGTSYLWQDNSTDGILSVSQAGTYIVEIFGEFCPIIGEFVVSMNDISVDLGTDLTLCEGENVILDATVSNGTYIWQDASLSPTFNVTESGTYSVEVMVDNCVSTDEINVNYNEFDVNLGSDTTICIGESLNLDATVNNGTYVWQNNNTLSSQVVTEAGMYSVDVTIGNCTVSDEIFVDVNDLEIDLGSDINACQGESVILEASYPGATFVWNDNSTLSTFDVLNSGTYSVIASLGACSADDEINVTITPLPIVDLGPDIDTCNDDPILLDASWPMSDYLWQDNSSLQEFAVTETGNYSVTVTSNGCSQTDDINIEFSGINIDLGPDISACDGETITLDASGTAGNYLWQDNSSNALLDVTQSGTYSVTITSGQCIASDEINLNFGLLEVDLGEDISICEGETVMLNATVLNGTYLWQDNSTNESLNVSETGVYSVNVNAGSCSDVDSIQVTVIPLPSFNLGTDQTYCVDTVITLDAGISGASYLWQDNSTSQFLSIDQSGTYTVSITQNGCEASDEVQINVGSFIINLGPDLGICDAETIVLDPGVSGGTYLWQDNSTSQVFSVSDAGTYSVEVLIDGCIANDEVVVISNAFEVDLGDDITICEGESVDLDCGIDNATYQWQDLSTEQTLDVSEAGLYSVTVYQNNCSSSDEILVSIGNPQVNLGNDTTLCEGQPIGFNAHFPGATYEWQDGSTDSTFLATSSGIYSVEVNLGSCATIDSILIEYIETPIIDLGPDHTICQGSSIELNAFWPNATYVWQDNSELSIFEVHEEGTYSVLVSVGTCSISDTISISTGLPEIFLGNDTSLCEGTSMNLIANVQNADVSWQDNSNSEIFTVSTEGLYWVSVDVDGCVNSDSIYVHYNPLPSASITGGMIHCPDEMVELEVNAQGTPPFLIGFTRDGIPLNSVETAQNFYSLTTNESGVYQVSSISDAYCYNGPQNSTSIIDYPPLEVNISYDESICQGESTLISAQYTGGHSDSYTSYWIDQNGQEYFENPITFTGPESSSFNLIGTDLCQSEIHEEVFIEVQEYPTPEIFATSDSICQGAEIILTSNYTSSDINCTWVINDHEFFGCGPITHNFSTSGYQDITLMSETSAGCVGITNADTLLFVLGNPNADFAYEGQAGNMFDPGVRFVNHSEGASEFYWEFGDGNVSSEEEPLNTYPLGESGEYLVCLTASNVLSCSDIHCEEIEILPELIIHIPNSFTPDEDGINDLFRPVLNDIILSDYSLEIYNRGGQIIFESQDQNEFWNGSNKIHSDYYVPDGVYTYQIFLREEGKSETKHYRGMINLIR